MTPITRIAAKTAAFVTLVALGIAAPANAKTFRWAFQGDAQSLDPHSLNETFSIGFLSNIYEPLAIYDDQLRLTPGLAVRWETPSPTKWVFHLRKNVRFHDGALFNADDVIFSWRRAVSEGSDQKARASLITNMRKIDDYTVEADTRGPQPTLMREMTALLIMDEDWARKHNATTVVSVSGGDESNYANLHTNGTGPFKLVSRAPDVRTVLTRNYGYWNAVRSNITQAVFTPIKQDATRIAALLSGEVHMVYPVPVQDWERLRRANGVVPLTGPEARTIFLGIDQFRDELLYSSVKGKNPFKDVRVRQAFAHAIDLNAIKDKVMRGASTPSGLMVAPQVNGHDPALNTPYELNPARAKQLLADAGYPNGFSLTLDCPNNRYVNDERICQAITAMLARIGVTVNLLAQPKSKYFGKVLAQNNYDTSFYLLGWTPGSIDSHNVLVNLLSCQDKENSAGLFNLGNYCSKEVDRLTKEVAGETNQQRRQQLISRAFKIVRDDYGYFPLHQQPLSWGAREGVVVSQRADNVFDLRNAIVP